MVALPLLRRGWGERSARSRTDRAWDQEKEEEMKSVGERIAEDWACGRLTGTVAEAIDEACAKAKSFAKQDAGCVRCNPTKYYEVLGDPRTGVSAPATTKTQGEQP